MYIYPSDAGAELSGREMAYTKETGEVINYDAYKDFGVCDIDK